MQPRGTSAAVAFVLRRRGSPPALGTEPALDELAGDVVELDQVDGDKPWRTSERNTKLLMSSR